MAYTPELICNKLIIKVHIEQWRKVYHYFLICQPRSSNPLFKIINYYTATELASLVAGISPSSIPYSTSHSIPSCHFVLKEYAFAYWHVEQLHELFLWWSADSLKSDTGHIPAGSCCELWVHCGEKYSYGTYKIF